MIDAKKKIMEAMINAEAAFYQYAGPGLIARASRLSRSRKA
jgi:hypothetical protein